MIRFPGRGHTGGRQDRIKSSFINHIFRNRLSITAPLLVLMLGACVTTGSPRSDVQAASERVHRIAAELREEVAGCRNEAESKRPLCGLSVRVVPTNEQNAVVTEDELKIGLGLVHLARTDDQLAFVIAHEFAHVELRHVWGSAFTDQREMLEMQADQRGLEIMMQAGFAPQGAINILTRVGANYGHHSNKFEYYPSFPERRDALRRTLLNS